MFTAVQEAFASLRECDIIPGEENYEFAARTKAPCLEYRSLQGQQHGGVNGFGIPEQFGNGMMMSSIVFDESMMGWNDPSKPQFDEGVANEDASLQATNLDNDSGARTKKLRARTALEQKLRLKEKHPILPHCQDSCKRHCKTKFTVDSRLIIHDEFWEMSKESQKQWLFKRITKNPVQRHRPTSADGLLKSCSLSYYLPDGRGNDVQVCQKMFLQTIGYTSNRVIVELMKN